METTIATLPLPEIKLAYSIKVKPSERPGITSSKDAWELLLSTWDKDLLDIQEQFKILLLNRSNKVLGIYTASSGGIHGTVVDIKLVLAVAINTGSTQIMLAHNHPSGSIRPSRNDETLTQKIKNAASFLEVKVVDHIILTSESYYSFADEGLL